MGLESTGSAVRANRALNSVKNGLSFLHSTGDEDDFASFQDCSYTHGDRKPGHVFLRFEESSVIFDGLRSQVG